MREYEKERNLDLERRKKHILETKMFPALSEATMQFHSRENSIQNARNSAYGSE